MWGQVIGAGINAAASLFGGGGGGQRDIYKQWKYQRYARQDYGEDIRIAAERSGINPLTLVGQVPNSNFTPGPSGGGSNAAPLASFGAALGSHFLDGNNAEDIAEAEEERTRKRAEAQLERIKVQAGEAGGVGEVVRTTKQTLNAPPRREIINSPVTKTGGLMAPYDRDREMEKLTATDGPGITTIDNDLLPGPVHVPGDGGEPWGIDELATVVVTGAPQLAWEFGKNLGRRYDAWSETQTPTSPDVAQAPRPRGVGFNRSQVDDYESRRRVLTGE